MSCQQYFLEETMLKHEILIALRKKSNATQEQVAQSIGTTARNYRRYEASDFDVKTSTLIALANYFDVSLDYLVGLSDNPKRN